MKRKTFIPVIISLCFLLAGTGCALVPDGEQQERARTLQLKAMNMRPHVEQYGEGGVEVFETAVEALHEGYLEGEYSLVSIEDLWTHSLQEGRRLFDEPDRLWGATGPEETADMIGQTTIGPWQMTVWNVQDHFGPRYGVPEDASPAEVVEWAEERPDVQARMIADYIQNAYSIYGKRSPYAIQSYFWLEPFVKGEIGQSDEWWDSPVARPPEGKTYEDLTPEMLADTGFYARQIVCGHPHQPRGLLFWLAVTGDIEAIDDLLETWYTEPHREWVEKDMPLGATGKAVATDKRAGMEIEKEDLQFIDEDEALIRNLLERRIEMFYQER